MPHVIVEHSANLAEHVDLDVLVRAVHEAALATGIAPIDALRTRLAPREHYAVADGDRANAFVAIVARLGPGRSGDEEQHLLQALLDTVDDVLGDARVNVMLSAEYQEIDPERRINRNHLRPAVRARLDRGEPDGC